MSSVDCAVSIQKVIRGWLARVAVLHLLNEHWEKIFDPVTHAYYYYNKVTDESSWEKPALLRKILGDDGDLESIASTYLPEQAAIMVQRNWRRKLAIRLLRQTIATIVTKIYDESTGAFYYYNNITGETSWNKPRLMGSQDVDEYQVATYSTDYASYDSSQGYYDENGVWVDSYAGGYYDIDGQWVYTSTDPEAIENTQTNAQKDEEQDSSDSDAPDQRLKRPPKKFPRSKMQALVDTAEESENPAKRATLDLSGLGATRVSSRIYELKDLRELIARDNVLSRISADLADTEGLTKLDLGNNRLKTLPGELGLLKNLVTLNVDNNQITSFAGSVYLMSRLETLNLRSNLLKEMPVEVGNVELLKLVREWEVGVGQLQALKVLDVGCNLIDQWPAQLDQCKQLQELRIDHNQLTEVSLAVLQNTALRRLYVNHNSIITLPTALVTLADLEHFDVSSNNIKMLSLAGRTAAEIAGTSGSQTEKGRKTMRQEKGLRKLRVLRAENCGLTALPRGLEVNPELQELSLSGNQLTSTEPPVLQLPPFRHLRSLCLSSCGLTCVPVGIATLPSLEIVDLSQNLLQDLPSKELGGLFRLSKINVSQNRLPVLGSWVRKLISLAEVDASNNELTEMPADLFKLNTLTSLDLSHNLISAIPDTISTLMSLKVLKLHHNRISYASAGLVGSINLEVLELHKNLLTELPPEWKKLQKLKSFTISDNQFDLAPSVVRLWPRLLHLDLSRNQLPGYTTSKWPALLQSASKGDIARYHGTIDEAVEQLSACADMYNDVIQSVVKPSEPPFAPCEVRGSRDEIDYMHHLRFAAALSERARIRRAEAKVLLSASENPVSEEDIHEKEVSAKILLDGATADLEQALETLGEVERIALLPKPLTVPSSMYVTRAQVLMTSEKHSAALACMRHLPRSCATHGSVQLMLATSRDKLGQYSFAASAIRALQRSLATAKQLAEEEAIQDVKDVAEARQAYTRAKIDEEMRKIQEKADREREEQAEKLRIEKEKQDLEDAINDPDGLKQLMSGITVDTGEQAHVQSEEIAAPATEVQTDSTELVPASDHVDGDTNNNSVVVVQESEEKEAWSSIRCRRVLEDIAAKQNASKLLLVEVEEGEALLELAVDNADLLRGYELHRDGVYIRNRAKMQETARTGRSEHRRRQEAKKLAAERDENERSSHSAISNKAADLAHIQQERAQKLRARFTKDMEDVKVKAAAADNALALSKIREQKEAEEKERDRIDTENRLKASEMSQQKQQATVNVITDEDRENAEEDEELDRILGKKTRRRGGGGADKGGRAVSPAQGKKARLESPRNSGKMSPKSKGRK